MFPINTKLTKLDLAFPANVIHMMPPYAELRTANYPRKRELEALVSRWFFSGMKNLKTKPREGVDVTKALAHLKCVLSSFEPSHEHKTAAVAFLINEWFEEFSGEAAK